VKASNYSFIAYDAMRKGSIERSFDKSGKWNDGRLECWKVGGTGKML
jgi:hypothetical protein